MMVNWTLIITAVGALGWLLVLREVLQHLSQSGISKLPKDSEFKIQHFSKPLGRVRFVTIEWRSYVYCVAVDMQGAYVQLIDKHPIKGHDV